MGQSLIIRNQPCRKEFAARLTIRTHDLGGTDYQGIVDITEDEALGLERAGMSRHFGKDVIPAGPVAHMEIKLREDVGVDKANWQLIVEMNGTQRVAGFINNNTLDDLIALGVQQIAVLPEDVDYISLDHALRIEKIASLREEADRLEASLSSSDEVETPSP